MRNPLALLLLSAALAGCSSAPVATGSAESRLPADPIDGPPYVTARGYAIGNPKNSKLLWGHNAEQPMKAASTTKIMCAFVVLSMADADPNVMREIVTFSKIADDTPGSTADIKAGESLAVAECLYGLLLPSGNDAGTALAEHFNARLAPPENPPADFKPDSRSNFIAEMNRTAAKYGLKSATYHSAFGDGAGEKQTTISPHDLFTLATLAMRHPVFRQYVGAVEHECELKTPGGGARKRKWTNTNQMLKFEGFDGVKTGTSTAAGNCLVASGHRAEDHLIIVVLGSSSADGRYIDIRNLFRWAWRQRGHKE